MTDKQQALIIGNTIDELGKRNALAAWTMLELHGRIPNRVSYYSAIVDLLSHELGNTMHKNVKKLFEQELVRRGWL